MENNTGRAKRFTLQRAILTTIAAAGVLGVAAVAPGALLLLKYTPQYRAYRQKKYSVNLALNKAVSDGYVEFEGGTRGKRLRITEKGRARLAKISVSGLGERRRTLRKRWDGKWRVVIYDIPMQKHNQRNMLRSALREYGFVCLQKSVWVYPHECQEIVTLLKAEFEIGKNVLYIIADTIENDKLLRKHFGVSYG